MVRRAALPALTFVDDSYQDRLLGKFRNVLGSVGVVRSSSEAANISFGAASIGDWGLCRVDGFGNVLTSGAKLDSHHQEYAILSLPISGTIRCDRAGRPFVGRQGELGLTRWDTLDDTILSGDFQFVAAYIPIVELQKWGGRSLAFDECVSATSGPGAICAAMLEQLTREALSVANTAPLASMLPLLAQVCVAAFEEQVANDRSVRPDSRFARVIDYLHSHMGDASVTSVSVAQACGVSDRQLYRLFSERNQAFSTTLRTIRLEAAAKLLLHSTHTNIGEIAFECGFQSPTHFSRLFRSTYGMLPKQYRRIGRAERTTIN